MSRIEQMIGEIEAYLDSCKAQAFSGSKRIVVEKDVIDDMMAELRMRTPEEIRKYQKIIANKDAILADAQKEADDIVAEANRTREKLVDEHEIMQQAYAQADDVVRQAQEKAQGIVDDAVAEANAVREGAMNYTDGQLANLETILSQSIEESHSRFEALLNTLQSSYDTITANRQELAGSVVQEQDPVLTGLAEAEAAEAAGEVTEE